MITVKTSNRWTATDPVEFITIFGAVHYAHETAKAGEYVYSVKADLVSEVRDFFVALDTLDNQAGTYTVIQNLEMQR